MDGLEVARTIVHALEDKKGEDILLMDLQGVTPFTDYFVIATGTILILLLLVKNEFNLSTRSFENRRQNGYFAYGSSAIAST